MEVSETGSLSSINDHGRYPGRLRSGDMSVALLAASSRRGSGLLLSTEGRHLAIEGRRGDGGGSEVDEALVPS
jgi:hypothetical protein